MSRRTFSLVLAALLAAPPIGAIAQGTTAVRRIGRLESGALETPDEISEELHKLG